ncbi:MAG: hypothetical protein ACOC41_06690 [Chitinivibrionales bacterium]
MPQSRFDQVLHEAYSVFCSASDFYSSEAKRSADHISKLFLYFLSAKRRCQQISLQMIARRYGIVLRPGSNVILRLNYSVPANGKTLDELLDFSHEMAEQELQQIRSMIQPDDETKVRSLIQDLKTMMRDYLFDINTGYLIFVSRKYSPEEENAFSTPKTQALAVY